MMHAMVASKEPYIYDVGTLRGGGLVRRVKNFDQKYQIEEDDG